MARRPTKPVPIGDLVAKLLARHGQETAASGRGAMAVLAAFQKIGPPVTDHAEAVLFRRGVLTLRVSESAWLTELTFLRTQILDRVNQELGRPAVKELRMRLGPLERPPPPPPPPRRPLDEAERRAVATWAEEVRDPDVRAALVRAAERSLQRGPVEVPPWIFGPPGPRPPPPPPPPPPEPGLTYGFGKRVVDRWKAKARPEEEPGEG